MFAADVRRPMLGAPYVTTSINLQYRAGPRKDQAVSRNRTPTAAAATRTGSSAGAQEAFLHDRHGKGAGGRVDEAPGEAPSARRSRAVLVVQEPLVGPERPVEPHGV